MWGLETNNGHALLGTGGASQGTSHPSWGQMKGRCSDSAWCQGQRKGAFGGRGQASKDLEAGTKGDPGVTEGGGQREERAGVHPSQHPCSCRVEPREARAEPGPIARPWMRERGHREGEGGPGDEMPRAP